MESDCVGGRGRLTEDGPRSKWPAWQRNTKKGVSKTPYDLEIRKSNLRTAPDRQRRILGFVSRTDEHSSGSPNIGPVIVSIVIIFVSILLSAL